MTQATPQQLAFGKTDTTKLYATIKNGNIYSLRAAVPASAGPALIAKIQAAGKINLKHWAKVTRTVKPASRPAHQAEIYAMADALIEAIVAKQFDAPEEPLTRDQYIAKHGSLPEDKSYSVVDADGYPISMADLMSMRAVLHPQLRSSLMGEAS